MTIYTAKAPVEISGFQAYADSSGAPAVVRVADFAYACDYLGGQVRLNCIKHQGRIPDSMSGSSECHSRKGALASGNGYDPDTAEVRLDHD